MNKFVQNSYAFLFVFILQGAAVAAIEPEQQSEQSRNIVIMTNILLNGSLDWQLNVLEEIQEMDGILLTESLVSAVVKAVNDSHFDVRGNAALTLAKINTKLAKQHAVPSLIEALQHYDKNVKDEACYYLGVLRTPKAIEVLVYLLSYHDASLKSCAVVALGKTASGNEKVRNALLLLLNAAETNDSLKTDIINSLAYIQDPQTVPNIINFATSSNDSVRLAVAKAFIKFKDNRTYDTLTDLIEDKLPEVRANAYEALGKLKDQRAGEPIVLFGLQDKNATVREKAAYALVHLKDKNTVSALLETLNDPVKNVRIAAIIALTAIADLKTANKLFTLFTHSKDIGQLNKDAIILTLGKMCDERAYTYLIKMLSRDGFYHKDVAIHVLGVLGDKRALPHLEKLLLKANSNKNLINIAIGNIAKHDCSDEI